MSGSKYNPHEEAAIERAKVVLSRIHDVPFEAPLQNDNQIHHDINLSETAVAYGGIVSMALSLHGYKMLEAIKHIPLEMVYGTAAVATMIVSHEVVENATHNSALSTIATVLSGSFVFRCYLEKRKSRTSTR